MKKILLLLVSIISIMFFALNSSAQDTIRVSFIDAEITASSVYDETGTYDGAMAFDVDETTGTTNLATRWATAKPADGLVPEDGYVLEVNFSEDVSFSHVKIFDYGDRVTEYNLKIADDTEIFVGTTIADPVELNNVTSVDINLGELFTTNKFVFTVTGMLDPTKGPSIWGVELYQLDGEFVTANNILEDAIGVYPTLVGSHLNISAINQVNTIDIFNITGKKVYSNSNPTASQIDVSSLKSGVYFVSIKSLEGNMFSQKVIKN